MSEIDEIEQAAALAEAETGSHTFGSKLRLCRTAGDKQLAARRWTAAEDAYVRENHGRQTEETIAAHLGRTATSIHIHIKREMRLTAPSKSPNILTGEQVAWGFGIDGKSVHMLMDRGLMPKRHLPGRDITRVIDRQALLLWMLEPTHWAYFDPARIGAMRPRGNRTLTDCYDFQFWEVARKLVLRAKAEWKDEWLTPGQVARKLGYKNFRTGAHSINAAIHAGNLPAVRWGNWRIRRSHLPAPGMTINVSGRIVPKIKPKYVCPRGMAHAHRSTCLKLRFCREAFQTA